MTNESSLNGEQCIFPEQYGMSLSVVEYVLEVRKRN